jgi:hypothetical protein
LVIAFSGALNTCRELLLLHQATSAFSVNGIDRVVQPAELEKVDFVFRRAKDVLNGRPF